jgi:hypothetical protein
MDLRAYGDRAYGDRCRERDLTKSKMDLRALETCTSTANIKAGDLVRVGQPKDTAKEYHNKIGTVEHLSTGWTGYYEDKRNIDEDGNEYWSRDPVYTGPVYWTFIVYFEDKSLDLSFLPFKEEDLTVLERSCNA